MRLNLVWKLELGRNIGALLSQLLWPERTLKMNVSPSPAGHLFFDRFGNFVFKKKLDRNFSIFVEIFRFQISNFQISDFKNFRFRKISKFQISKFPKCWFQLHLLSDAPLETVPGQPKSPGFPPRVRANPGSRGTRRRSTTRTGGVQGWPAARLIYRPPRVTYAAAR